MDAITLLSQQIRRAHEIVEGTVWTPAQCGAALDYVTATNQFKAGESKRRPVFPGFVELAMVRKGAKGQEKLSL